MAGGCSLFHHGCVLLGYLVHFVDRRRDLYETRCLISRCDRKAINTLGYVRNAFGEIAEIFTRALNESYALVDLLCGDRYETFDLIR